MKKTSEGYACTLKESKYHGYEQQQIIFQVRIDRR